jgi:hypothetical protein
MLMLLFRRIGLAVLKYHALLKANTNSDTGRRGRKSYAKDAKKKTKKTKKIGKFMWRFSLDLWILNSFFFFCVLCVVFASSAS